jgi:hypothetical protein
MEFSTAFARWLHTFTQLPHPMQRSPMTSAWPPATRMAFAGHSRTHVKHTRHRSLIVLMRVGP